MDTPPSVVYSVAIEPPHNAGRARRPAAEVGLRIGADNTGFRPLKLLLVDDNPADTELIERHLLRAGYHADWTRVDNEDDLVKQICSNPPEVILSEWALEHLDGLRVLEIIRESEQSIPLLIISGHVDEETAMEAVHQGAADFLLKDRLARIGRAIEHAIEQARLRKEHRSMMAELRQAEARYRGIFENAIEGIFQATPEGRLTAANPALARILGFSSPHETIGMVDDIIDQLSPDSQNQAELRSRLEESGIVTGFETQALCAAGRRTWVAINCRSVRSEDGAPRIEGTVVDVTERRKLETQLIRAQRMESVGQLASGLAHDLNNILLPIQIYPGLLRERIQEASLRDLVDAIETSARRGATIVRQLLTFSRGSQAERTSVKMDGLVNEMLGIIQETFPKDINIHSNLQSAVRTVRGDTNQLHQVLLNLCVNARDAMPNGGDISLSVEDCFVDEEMARANAGAQPGPHVLLKVADTGCGIPPENMDKVFEPFFTTKEIGKGTGLGLSTVLGIVSNHGGFIQVDTAPGQGTRFRVYLPADPSDSPVVAEPSQEPEVRGNGEILLVVDDERAVRHATRVVCERAGYRVIEARNGLDALDRLKEPDCEVAAVISDVLMPRMGGVDFIQRLRQLPGGGPPVLAMTGLSKSPEITRLRALENVPLIEKPFTSTLLLQSVGRLLRQHREAHAVPPQ